MRWAGIAPIVRIMQIDADCPDDASTGGAPRPLIHGRLTGEVIGAFYEIYNELGFGFLESVYSSALEIEFRDRRIPYVRELPLEVIYKGRVASMSRADFLVDGKLVVEVKATRRIGEADKDQLLHYLRGTRTEVGLLLHFGPKAEFYRVVNSING